tara:strand:+ start:970 stop:3120 length:2151 start_codon:yes stop_codon:yes gene_type:complete
MTILKTNKLAGSGGTNAIDGSLFFSDTNDRLSVPNSADVRVGSGDFTIEAWIRAENPGDWTTIIGMWDSSATRRTYVLQRKKADSKLYFYVSADGGSTISATATQVASGGDVTLGDWHHVAGVRDGNTIRAYLNGVEVGNASFTASILNNTTDALFIGDTEVTAGGEAFNGYMSNVRMVKGTCLYPSGTTFTPPTEKLTAIDGTVLLCCQDSDDPTQEATGKTITGYGRYFAATGELFANTGFSADSDWTKGSGWTISGGLATHAQGSAGDLAQQISGLVIGSTYKLSVDIISTDDDVAYFFIDNNPGGNYPPLTTDDSSPVGNHQIFFEANATTMWLGFRGSSLWAGTLTNLRLSSADHGKAPRVLPPVGTDSGTVLEGGVTFDSLNYMTLPKGTTAERVNSRGRAVIAGGYNPSLSPTPSRSLNTIEYIEINTTANAVDFGDLHYGSASGGTCSSSTRAVTGGGYVAPSITNSLNTMSYFTIASTGNGAEFAELSVARAYVSSLSSDTRGIWAGGAGGPSSPYIQSDVSITDYVTIASQGVDAQDFGELIDQGYMADCACSSPTRGVIAGGNPSTNVIQYVTIASTGVAKDFGDLIAASIPPGAASSSTRGIFCGSCPGAPAYTSLNHIDYVTIASTGNAQDFGDSLFAGSYKNGTSNSVRAVWTGTYTSPTPFLNSIEYVQIQTLGNTVDFGDSTNSYGNRAGATSDTHGGLA